MSDKKRYTEMDRLELYRLVHQVAQQMRAEMAKEKYRQ